MILGQSCIQGSERIVSKVVGSKEHDSKIRKEFNNFPMNGTLFYTPLELSPLRTEKFRFGQAMDNCSCSLYRIIDPEYTTQCKLNCLQTHPIHISTFEGDSR